MDMKKTMMKVGSLISFGNGILLGTIFSIIGMLKSPEGIIPMGVVISALLSAVISVIVGFIIPIKTVTDKAQMKLGIDPARRKVLAWLTEGVVGDLIYTPILCTYFMIYNSLHGQYDHVPVPIVLIWLKELGLDFIIALIVNLTFLPLLRKLVFKAFGVNGRPGEKEAKEERQ